MSILGEENCKNEEISEIYNVMEIISDNMYCNQQIAITKDNTYALSGQSITASTNTLKSIDYCCSQGFFSDAFTLARKYRDDIMQYLFLSFIVGNIKGLSDEDINKHYSEGMSLEKLYEAVIMELDILKDGSSKTDREFAVEAWMSGKLADKTFYNARKDYFDTSKYKRTLKEDEQIQELINNFLEDTWKEIDRVLNNYVHANGNQYILDNYPQYGSREQKKKRLIDVLRKSTSIFICIITIMEPNRIQSKDYSDYMEFNEEPPEDCQYWVASRIINYMTNHLKTINEDLMKYLNDTNRYGMRIL